MLSRFAARLLFTMARCQKRKHGELSDLKKNGTPVTEARVIGIGIEMALRKSLAAPPLRLGDVTDVRLSSCADARTGRALGEVSVEVSSSGQDALTRFALATRLVLHHDGGLNVARVDVRRRGAAAEGFHDLICDACGGLDVVGEVRCRNIMLGNGRPSARHLKAVCEGVLGDYEVQRAAHSSHRGGALLVLCCMSRAIGGPWNHFALRVAMYTAGAWYSLYQFPGLEPLGLAGVPVLPCGELPSVDDLYALAVLPRPARVPQPQGQPLAPQLPVQELPAQLPAQEHQAPPLFVVCVPRRQPKPARKPESWGDLLARLTSFEVSAGVTVCLVSDFLTQMRQDKAHTDQDVRRWRKHVGVCRDEAALFRLQGPIAGVPGLRPWVSTLECIEAVFESLYKR